MTQPATKAAEQPSPVSPTGSIWTRIAGAALILMLGSVTSRALGLVREQVIAGVYGRTIETDAYTIAFSVPSTVYDFLIGGMISAALVPVLAEYAERGNREYSRLAVSFVTAATAVLAIAAGVVYLLAGPLLSVIGAGFAADTRAFGVVLLQVMVPAVMLMGLAGTAQALLYSQHRFMLPAFGAAVFNLGIIICAVLFRATLGVQALALGVVVGAAAQLALQIPGLRGLEWRSGIDLRHPALRRIIWLYLPVAAGLAVSAVGVAIDRRLASFTLAGDPTAMRYATTLVQFPLGLIGVAISTAVLPTLSAQAAGSGEAIQRFKRTFGYGLKLIVLAIVPATLALVMLREPIVRLLFERGAFGPDDTVRTALAFLAYSPGLPAASLDQFLIFAFYARKKPVIPAVVGVLGIGVYLAVALSLIGPLGMPGLAIANACQWVAHASIMFVLVWRELGSLRGLGLGQVLGKSLFAGLVMTATLALGWRLAAPFAADTVRNGLAVVGIAALGGLIYVGLLLALRVPEITQFWKALRQRLMLRATE